MTDDESPLGRPMRWGQLTLVANDPGRFDLAFWLDYFRRTHVEGVCLSAGGCVAYYPTQVPLHHRSPWLGETDPFGDLVAGCREMGMVVVARTDPHACHQDAFEAHPDWVAVDAEGNPRRHWSHPDDYWVTCALGPYNFEFMTRVTGEIVARYGVDGIFSNRWSGHGVCYCEHCRANFREARDMDLPRPGDPDEAARLAYAEWREQRLFEPWDVWDGEVRRANPRARFIPNTGGGALFGMDMAVVAARSSLLVADRQTRTGMMAPWAAGKNAKEYRAAGGSTAVAGLFSVGLETSHRWTDSVQARAEVRVWMADGVAQGFRPWYCKFSGTLHDERWLGPVQEAFAWHHRNERYLRNEENLARVGLVYSQQTARYYGGDRAYAKVEEPILGAYQALVEARVPFEMVHDRLLDPEHVNAFRLLVLPNVAALSDEQCDQLRAFVKRGGCILATHETSLYDECGRRRDDFGLADLFGVSFGGEAMGPMKNAYLRLNHPHPVLAGLDDAPRIIHGVHRLTVTPRADFAATPLTLIPAYPDLPMEEVYPRDEACTTPELYLRETAGGRVAYFNWDIARTFWEVLAGDHLTLLANTVKWTADEAPPVEVTGPGVLDIAVWRQAESVTVHLVNLTNPMMMKGPYREAIPCPAQRVRVRLPEGTRARGVRLLVAGREPEADCSGGWVEVTVPSVRIHEVVAIDLEA